MRILVVEDDEVAAEYVRKGLMEAGHVVLWVLFLFGCNCLEQRWHSQKGYLVFS